MSKRKHHVEDSDEGPIDTLVPDPQVWREFGVTSMTLFRWTHNAKLGFPPPIKINNRNFRSRRQIEAFKDRMLRKALTEPEQAA
jgi:hypothetical protein